MEVFIINLELIVDIALHLIFLRSSPYISHFMGLIFCLKQELFCVNRILCSQNVSIQKVFLKVLEEFLKAIIF